MFWHNEQWNWKLKIFALHCDHAESFTKKKENSDVDSRNKTAFISWQLFTFTVMSRLFYCRLIFLTYLFLQSHNSSFAKLSQHQKIIRWVAPTYAQNSIANLYDKNNFSRNIRACNVETLRHPLNLITIAIREFKIFFFNTCSHLAVKAFRRIIAAFYDVIWKI